MSLHSWKKNLNRVGQKLNEKVAGYKGTQKGENYKAMTDLIDLHKKYMDEVSSKTIDVLQPNPAIRAKMGAIGTLSKLRGGNGNKVYRQAEAELAETMGKYALALGPQSTYGRALQDAGTAFIDIADIKYRNEDNIREYFIDPIHNTISRDIKEINTLRKKCESKRLDYDTERKSFEKSQKSDDSEVRAAHTAFEEAMEHAAVAMADFLNSETHHIENLAQMVKSMVEFHNDSAKVLKELHEKLLERQATSEHQAAQYSFVPNENNPLGAESPGFNSTQTRTEPCCRALFQFKAENDNELEFEAGDIIKLIEQVDGNWYWGQLHGRSGHFPINYVEVLQPLPSI